MKNNILRKKLENNEVTIGTRIITPWAGLFEFIGDIEEIQYIEYSGEYSPFDLELLNNICMACDKVGVGSLMKVDQAVQTFLAQRALGAGFEGVLFTDIRSVEEAKSCVEAVRPETPEGGINPAFARRCTGYIKNGGSPEFVQAMEDAIVAIMIEKKGAVDNIRDILSIEGIDMVQFGPSDYAMSIGKTGQRDDEKVKEAEKKVIETALEMGVAPRAEISFPSQAEKYMEMGVRHFNIGFDMKILYRWLEEKSASLHEKVMGTNLTSGKDSGEDSFSY